MFKEEIMKPIPLRGYFILLLVILLPIEHKYDHLIRPFFYHYTTFAKPVVKGFYFYITDILLLLLVPSLFWIKLFLQRGVKYLTLCAVMVFVSLIFATTTVTAVEWMKAVYFCLSLLLVGIISQIPITDRWLQGLFFTLFLLGIFESAVGIGQYFSHGPMGLKLLSEPPLLAKIQVDGQERIRAYGTLPHPNVLGGFLMTTIFSTISLLTLAKKKWLYLLGLTPQLMALLLTFSRSALFALFLGLFFLNNKKIISITICILAVFVLTFSKELSYRGGIFNYNSAAQDSDLTRLEGIKSAIEIVKKFPLTGVGFSNYDKAAKVYFKRPVPVMHNIYLSLAAEIGILGFIFFTLFILSTFIRGWQYRKNPLFKGLLSMYIGFLFIGGCDGYPLFFHQARPLFFLIAGILQSFSKMGQESSSVLPPRREIQVSR